MIAAGKAQYVVHVECALTRYRALFTARMELFRFEVPASLIDGRVEVCSFILALDNLPAYVNAGFHQDYHVLSFSVRRGDALAVAPDHAFNAEKKTDPLRKIPSIFVVVQDEADDAPAMDIDTDGHKVRVSLSVPNFEAYTYLRQVQPLHSTLNSMIIIPALAAVLDGIRRAASTPDGLAALESRRWYATVVRRLKELGVEPSNADGFPDSSLALAQKLIGEPLTDGLKNLRSYEETNE